MPPRRPPSLRRAYLTREAVGGLILMAAAALGLALANSPAAAAYESARAFKLGPLSALHWINDGLMALFFLVVGLEIKRELIDGQLSTWERRLLPGLCAIGGMAVPALVYVAFNAGDSAALRGWAVPSATDIAFALGVLALLGRRVPASIKLLLTAIAIIDDLGAILIIAAFYTEQLALGALAAAGGLLAALALLNKLGVRALWPYLALGLALWWATHESGLHATLAGVALALTIPLTPTPGRPDDAASPLYRLEHALQPWVAFAIVPLFGLANAGVALGGAAAALASGGVAPGIAAGLVLGKPVGVLAAAWLAVRARGVNLPAFATWRHMAGMGALCGIGFTMSLFIAELAFAAAGPAATAAKLGILAGSGLAALAGAAILATAKRG